MQTTLFGVAPCRNERPSLVPFRLFTAEDYGKMKQKEYAKERVIRSKPKQDCPDGGSNTGLRSNRKCSMTPSSTGSGRDYRHEHGLQTSGSFSIEGGYDSEMIDAWSFTSEHRTLSSELDELLAPSASIDIPADAAVQPLEYPTPPVMELFDHDSLPECASRSEGVPTSYNDVSGEGRATGLSGEAPSGSLGRSTAPSDEHCSTHLCNTEALDPGVSVDIAPSAVSNSTDSESISMTVPSADAKDGDDELVLVQASESSVLPPPPITKTDVGSGWTPEQDSLLRHLHGTAGLPWSRIVPYFPDTAEADLCRRFTESTTATVGCGEDITAPKRKRGRPRKCEHPSRVMKQNQAPRNTRRRQAYQARVHPSRPSTTFSCDRGSVSLGGIIRTDPSRSSPSRQPVTRRRGRKPKTVTDSHASTAESGRSQNEPTWAVDRIVSRVEIDGKQYYRVRWEETLEPEENMRGCADTAIAEYHRRHLL